MVIMKSNLNIINTAPSGPKTGYSNKKCYAKSDNNCAQKITKEHIIGKGVTGILEAANPIEDGKLGFFGPNYVPKIPVKDFFSYTLCKRHNEALSAIDTIGIKFFRNLFGMQNKNEDKDIPGYEFERWMLKVLCNISSSGNWFSKGKKIPKLKPHPTFLKILFEGFPFPEGWGLYIAKEIKNRGPLAFSWFPMITQAVHGLEFKFKFIRIVFAIGDIRGMHEKLIYHPLSLALDLPGVNTREIRFLW
jgi:hypothetical protein